MRRKPATATKGDAALPPPANSPPAWMVPLPDPEPTIPAGTSRALEVARLAAQLAGPQPGGPRDWAKLASELLREAERVEGEREVEAWSEANRWFSFKDIHRRLGLKDARSTLDRVRKVMVGVDDQGTDWAKLTDDEIKMARLNPLQARMVLMAWKEKVVAK